MSSPATDIADAVGSGTLHRVKDRDLILSPLTLDDLGVIQRTAVDAAYDEAERRIKFLEKYKSATEANVKQVMDALFARVDTGTAERDYLVSPAGTALAAWLSARHQHSDLTYEWCLRNLDFREINTLQKKLDRMSFGERQLQPPPAPDERDAAEVDGEGTPADPQTPDPQTPAVTG